MERKLRAERQARLHQEELSTEAVSSSVPAKAKEGKGKVEEGVTMISVRFPDSSVLKGRFEGGKTLKDVRSWVDETRNMSTAPPYVFQTTFPTRTFEVSEEEHETLSSLFGKGGQVVLKVHPYSRVVWLMVGNKNIFSGLCTFFAGSRWYCIIPFGFGYRYYFKCFGMEYSTCTTARNK